MLLCISNVVRHRICRRPFERHTACVALGDGTDTDVAETCQQIFQLFSMPVVYICIMASFLRPPSSCSSGANVVEGK